MVVNARKNIDVSRLPPLNPPPSPPTPTVWTRPVIVNVALATFGLVVGILSLIYTFWARNHPLPDSTAPTPAIETTPTPGTETTATPAPPAESSSAGEKSADEVLEKV
ncbi:hypothetical protein M6B38_256855 [Iris pallida]|uniref:Uncharacterized protein n=1 Tax=Iris pallida TaxID=29817 RepID=A0AAX6IFX9_IRIPA|nr:hypothetical protein M6B38_256855 [Iris pallida]